MDNAFEKARAAYGTGAYDDATLEFLFPALKESEDERIRKAILGLTYIDGIEPILTKCSITAGDIRAYLEKHKDFDKMIVVSPEVWDKAISDAFENGKKEGEKQDHLRDDTKMVEQKPVEHKTFEEWVKDYWSHNKVNNPYSYNKGDEIQFDHKGFVSFCETYSYPQNLILHDTFGYEEGRQTGRNEGVKLVLNNPEKYGLQKEQKPADEQFPPLEGLDAIKAKYYDDGFKNGFDEGVASVKPAEWSEEDERMRTTVIQTLERFGGRGTTEMQIDWLKSLRPQPKQELSIEKAIQWLDDTFYFLDNSSGRGKDCEITTHDFDSLEEMYDSFRKAVIVDSQPSWKPSEKELEALERCIDYLDESDNEDHGIMQALYEQLKQL